jgi:pimeloyl-ACP methyl ester carboxylesterase
MALAFYDPEPFTKPAMIDEVKTALDRPGAIAAALAAARGQRFKELQERYHTILQPALLIWGEQDRISRLRFGQRLTSELPHARLVVIPRCGHLPMMERPSKVLLELLAFLTREG